MIALRMGSGHDKTITVIFWQGVIVLALIAPFALWLWVTPGPADAALLLLMGLLFTAGLWLFTAGLRLGDTSALAPLHYLRLIMMAVVGWLFYNEVPTLTTAIGALLIISAATYTLIRNARRRSVVQPEASGA